MSSITADALPGGEGKKSDTSPPDMSAAAPETCESPAEVAVAAGCSSGTASSSSSEPLSPTLTVLEGEGAGSQSPPHYKPGSQQEFYQHVSGAGDGHALQVPMCDITTNAPL